MPWTNDICEITGWYQCGNYCGARHFFWEATQFSPCSRCRDYVEWLWDL